MTKEKNKPEKDRFKPGSRPPRFTLGEAVGWAVAIFENLGGKTTKEDFASMLGNSTKSSGFVAKLNTLKNYGLVIEDDKRLELTEAGESIAAPVDPSERNAALKTAFLQIDNFKSIYAKFTGKLLPQGEFLKNSFVQAGISRDLADGWMEQFISSGQTAGLLVKRPDGKFLVREAASEIDLTRTPNEEEDASPVVSVKPVVLATERHTPSVAVTKKTPYQFLTEIYSSGAMEPAEEEAVFTLMRFLKRQDGGIQQRRNSSDSD